MNSRKKPAHGVRMDGNHPVIVFVSVCTKGRHPWLASAENHVALRHAWQAASAWLVGRYVLMPDHLHLFAAPGRPEISLDNWIRFWKSRFTMARSCPRRNGRLIIGIPGSGPANPTTKSGCTSVKTPCVPV